MSTIQNLGKNKHFIDLRNAKNTFIIPTKYDNKASSKILNTSAPYAYIKDKPSQANSPLNKTGQQQASSSLATKNYKNTINSQTNKPQNNKKNEFFGQYYININRNSKQTNMVLPEECSSIIESQLSHTPKNPKNLLEYDHERHQHDYESYQHEYKKCRNDNEYQHDYDHHQHHRHIHDDENEYAYQKSKLQLNMDMISHKPDQMSSSPLTINNQNNDILLKPLANVANKNMTGIDKSNHPNHYDCTPNSYSTKSTLKNTFNFPLKDISKENITITKNYIDLKEYGNHIQKSIKKKSTENLHQIIAQPDDTIINRQCCTSNNNNISSYSHNNNNQLAHTILQADVNESNASPLKHFRYITPLHATGTGTKPQQEIKLTRNASNVGPTLRKFHLNDDKINDSRTNLESEEISPIKISKIIPNHGHNANGQNIASATCLLPHGQIDFKDKDGLLKERKNIINQPYSTTITKHINLVASNTPTAGKPPLHSGQFALTQMLTSNEKLNRTNFEGLKNTTNLNIQTVKDKKNFEFPAYLNNQTCDTKKKTEDIFFNQMDLNNYSFLREKIRNFPLQNLGIDEHGHKAQKLEQNYYEGNNIIKEENINDSPKSMRALKNSPNANKYSLTSLGANLADLSGIKAARPTQPYLENAKPNHNAAIAVPMACTGIASSNTKFDKGIYINVDIDNNIPQVNPQHQALNYKNNNHEYSFKENPYCSQPYSEKDPNTVEYKRNSSNPSNPQNNLHNNGNNNTNGNNRIKKSIHKESHNKDDPGQSLSNPKEISILDQGSTEREMKLAKFKENYKIYHQIGQGAYASVRLAIYKPINMKVAIKIYEKQKIMEPNRRKSVIREIKLMQKMDHPNIIKIYDAFESRNHVNIIMEYVGGGSLHGHLKAQPNRRLKEEDAYKLFKQAVSGIAYCHNRWISHRDIKLENLLMDEFGVVKIIDFGFSTCIPNDKKVKMFCGTPSYMAPEIILKKEYCGPPADIWALGVLLHTLLCGAFPFKGATDKELYHKILKAEFALPDFVSETASDMIKKMLNLDADKRPTAKDLFKESWMIQHAMMEKKDNSEHHTITRKKVATSNEKLALSEKHNQPSNTSYTNINTSALLISKPDLNISKVSPMIPINQYTSKQPQITPTNTQNRFFYNSQFDNHTNQKSSTKNLSPNTTMHRDGSPIYTMNQMNNMLNNNKTLLHNLNDTYSNNNSATAIGPGTISGGFGINYNNTIFNENHDEINDPKSKNSKNSINLIGQNSNNTNNNNIHHNLQSNNNPNSNLNSNSSPNLYLVDSNKATCNKRYESNRPSINHMNNIFFGMNTISNTTSKKELIDIEIVNKLIIQGHNEDEIMQSIKERNGLLYTLYLKNIQDKKLGNSTTPSHKTPSIVDPAYHHGGRHMIMDYHHHQHNNNNSNINIAMTNTTIPQEMNECRNSYAKSSQCMVDISSTKNKNVEFDKDKHNSNSANSLLSNGNYGTNFSSQQQLHQYANKNYKEINISDNDIIIKVGNYPQND